MWAGHLQGLSHKKVAEALNRLMTYGESQESPDD